MAGNDGSSVADSERCLATPTCKEGPVLSTMSKRLRALKKKYNKILQIEESKVQGKAINKEQEEVLKTKIAVAALIDEYEKLRQPLVAAVKEELEEREKELLAATLRRDDRGEDENGAGEEKEPVWVSCDKPLSEVRMESTSEGTAVCSSEDPVKPHDTPAGLDVTQAASHDLDQEHRSSGTTDGSIGDLLTFLYFAQLFNVRSHGETSSLLWTKAHERSSCLSYDCVTEDETSPLLETDLDDLSFFGLLLTSRPPNATLSHRDALQQCIEHAQLWLQNSEKLVKEDLNVSYAHLRERLNRILSSEYFTMIPELQTVIQQTEVAAQYAPEMLIHKGAGGNDVRASDVTSVYFSPQDETSLQPPFHIGEPFIVPAGTEKQIEAPIETDVPDTSAQDKVVEDDSYGDSGQLSPTGGEKELDHTGEQQEAQDGQQPEQSHILNVTVGPRGHQGPKSGGRVYNSGRGRGHTNGRGARSGGGRGGYGNGWGGQYYDQGGYLPRNYNGRGGGSGGRRGMRGNSSTYNNGYANGGQAGRGTNNMHG